MLSTRSARSQIASWYSVVALFVGMSPFLSAQPHLLQSGPMVGYGEMTEVMLWAQTTRPAAVQFRYWPVDSPKARHTSPSVQTGSERAHTAHVLITGLQPGTKYAYELLINGKPVPRPYPLRFQTKVFWHWRTDPPDFTVAFGSCAYVNDPPTDRPGKPYGSHEETFTEIVKLQPDLMLWLGDNTYTREVDWHTVDRFLYRYTHTRSLPELQPLLGSVHHYATWDDHDYGPNDADRSYRLKSQALDIFKMFWANQTYGADGVPGVFGRFEWGDVEFFLLDDRYHRSPNRSPDDATKTMFGREQVQWLKDCLVSSNATFKVVVNGSQVLNPHRVPFLELFSNYSHEYADLLGYIKQQRVSGVVFLSGDRHHAELMRIVDTTFYTLYDFTSSPFTAGMALPVKDIETDSPHRVPGTLVIDHQNFGVLRFSGPRRDRKLVMECRDHTGTLRWSHEVKASDLMPPRQ